MASSNDESKNVAEEEENQTVKETPQREGSVEKTEKAAEESVHSSTKIDILLNATGNVPIIKKRKWAVEQNKPISSIIAFIHKYLKLEPEEKLFLYVNQTFAPSPDQIIKNLYDCYGSNGKLVLYYCKSQAWG